jgi:GNAT superfamily N-acetyltransferase
MDAPLIRHARPGEPWVDFDHRARVHAADGSVTLLAHLGSELVGCAHLLAIGADGLLDPADFDDTDVWNGPYLHPWSAGEDWLLLSSLWVAPAARRRGVARALMDAAAALDAPVFAEWVTDWLARWADGLRAAATAA